MVRYSKALHRSRDEGSRKIEKSFNLKKKNPKMENEVIKVLRTPFFVPNSFGDRFIPRRYNMKDLVGTSLVNGANLRVNDILYMKNCDGFWRHYAMRKCLDINFWSSRATTLLFHDYLTKEFFEKALYRGSNFYQNVVAPCKNNNFDWPCLPRRKSIAVIEISHVIKNYSHYSHLNVISWSSIGNMAASFGEDLVLWIPKGKFLLTYEMKGITCLSYSCDGKYLALGIKLGPLKPSEIQVWDVSSESIGIFITSFKYKNEKDAVRCVLWDPKHRYVVSGMLCGNVYVHKCSNSLKMIKKLPCSEYCVDILQLSTNQTFLAASDKGGNVFVWNFGTFETVFRWNEKDVSSALIAWHPWKESYLIISATLPASICLIDVKANAMIAYYSRTDELCRIDAITFNPKSAELVVSLSLYDDESVTYEILVLAALDRVVDLLNIHDGRVKCLIWNSDGDMLATAGDDNMLNIWNFFGYSEIGPPKSDSKQKCGVSKFTLGNPSLLR